MNTQKKTNNPSFRTASFLKQVTVSFTYTFHTVSIVRKCLSVQIWVLTSLFLYKSGTNEPYHKKNLQLMLNSQSTSLWYAKTLQIPLQKHWNTDKCTSITLILSIHLCLTYTKQLNCNTHKQTNELFENMQLKCAITHFHCVTYVYFCDKIGKLWLILIRFRAFKGTWVKKEREIMSTFNYIHIQKVCN